jgi:hypothetical protein
LHAQIFDRNLHILIFQLVSSKFHLGLGKAVKSPLKGEVHFQKYGIFYCVESSFSNDGSERSEDHFEKWSEEFFPITSNINSLS